MRYAAILRYLVIALIVMMLGGLAGWYMFVKREIKTTGAVDAARGFGNAAPFGSSVGSANQNTGSFTTSTSSEIATGSAGAPAPRLWHVTTSPVAGEGFASTSARLYFAERATGNILAADPSSQSIDRLTNTLFPKIYEALFRSDGSAILRSLTDDGTITTYSGSIGTTTPGTPAALSGVYLAQNIVAIGVRDASTSIVALIENPNGGVMGVTAAWEGQKQKQVFSSALSQWRLYTPADGAVYLVQNASDDVPGYAFQLKGAALSTVLGGMPGLVILPRASSTALLYSTSQDGSIALFTRPSASSTAVRLPIKTLAEKCAWAPGTALIAYCAVPQSPPTGAYEQSWYQGAVHTADSWWKVDASAGTAEQLFAPDSGPGIDAVDPQVDPTGSYIAFRNAADQSLWMLRINP